MSTAADLESATAKLATVQFTEAETEAIALFLTQDHDTDHDTDDVTGFAFEPNTGKGFLLEVSGCMPRPKTFTATDDLTKVVACSSPSGD